MSSPAGLAIDGDKLWVVDDSRATIFRYSLSTAFSGTGNLKAVQTIAFTTGNASAEGLAIDASYLYVLDDEDKQVYRYPRSGGIAVASKIMREANGNSLSTPSGAALDETTMYIVDKSRDKLYGYSLSSLFSGTSNLNASFEFKLNTANSEAQGLDLVP